MSQTNVAAPIAIFTQHAPAPIGPYSQAVRVGNFLFCSGQIPLDPKTGELVSDDVSIQTQQVMANIAGVLKAAGASFAHIVKTTIYLVDMDDFPAVNEIYAERFATLAPARSTVAVSALPRGARVEIEVTAVVGP